MTNRFSLLNRLRTMGKTGWNPIGNEAADEIELKQVRIEELELENQKLNVVVEAALTFVDVTGTNRSRTQHNGELLDALDELTKKELS